MSDEPVVTLARVCKQYDGAGEPITVLRDLDLVVTPGGCTAVVGPSGCGKSTLLKLIGLLDTPTSGEMKFQGRDARDISAADAARLRNRQLGFVFQSHMLLPQCTAIENVLIPTLVERTRKADMERAKSLMERVGLGNRLHHRPGQLSGGECQRVAVVRALINQPALLLADEPTGSLNEEAAVALADLLIELNREQSMALLVVTHSKTVAERMGRVLELRGGALVPGA